MANGVGELGAVQRIEVKLLDAVPAQLLHLIDRHVRCDHAARLRILVQPIEAPAQPFGNGGTATLGKAEQLGKTGNRQNSRHDADANTRGDAAIAVAQERIRVEKELRDGAIGARVDFTLQVVQIGLDTGGFRMSFRIRSDRNLERLGELEPPDQIRCIGKPARVGPVAAAGPSRAGRIPAQCDHMPYPVLPIILSDTDDLFARAPTQVRCGATNRSVSRRIRSTHSCVLERVEPSAP